MSKKSKDKLIELYQKVFDEVIRDFEKRLREGKDIDYQAHILKSILNAFKEAKELRGDIRISLQEEYIERKLNEYENARPMLSPKQQKFPFEEFTKIDNTEIENLYKIFNNNLNRAEKGIGRQIKVWFEKEQKGLTHATNKTVRDELVSRYMGKNKDEAINGIVNSLKENIYFKLVDKNGNHLKMKIDSYAKLSLNTMFQQAKNTASINTVKQLESELVIFSKHFWTCEVCAKYAEGRVYSINSKNKEYPYLYSIPGFIKGYNSIHPNCKHLLTGFYETGRSKEEIEKIKNLSNSDNDTRREKDKEHYDLKQKLNIFNGRKRALENELKRFNGVKITSENSSEIETLKIRLKNIKNNIKKINKRLREIVGN